MHAFDCKLFNTSFGFLKCLTHLSSFVLKRQTVPLRHVNAVNVSDYYGNSVAMSDIQRAFPYSRFGHSDLGNLRLDKQKHSLSDRRSTTFVLFCLLQTADTECREHPHWETVRLPVSTNVTDTLWIFILCVCIPDIIPRTIVNVIKHLPSYLTFHHALSRSHGILTDSGSSTCYTPCPVSLSDKLNDDSFYTDFSAIDTFTAVLPKTEFLLIREHLLCSYERTSYSGCTYH